MQTDCTYGGFVDFGVPLAPDFEATTSSCITTGAPTSTTLSFSTDTLLNVSSTETNPPYSFTLSAILFFLVVLVCYSTFRE